MNIMEGILWYVIIVLKTKVFKFVVDAVRLPIGTVYNVIHGKRKK